MLPTLTELEMEVIDFLEMQLRKDPIAPSIDEICQAVRLTRGYRINKLLNSLREKGYIDRRPGRARSLRLLLSSDGQPFQAGSRLVQVPVLGLIAAGSPIDPQDGFDDFIEITSGLIGDPSETFALRVKGDSMIEDSVLDGDLVILQHQTTASNGDMVAAWLLDSGETTLKRYYREGRQIRLKPANAGYADRVEDESNVQVQGKVVAVVRQLM
ncbi:MAG: transcriptional repressor LexA [Chloroflexota bacterium]|nr:transcriptional repressor LexA [Chloroflexota bacterium]